MPETDVIPTSASIASTGLGIRYIGNYCYAYSGVLTTAGQSQELTLLEFTSGSGFIRALSEPALAQVSNSGADYLYRVYFNDVVIYFFNVTRFSASVEDLKGAINLIIPPFTNVKMTAESNFSGTNDFCWILTGRVYGAV